MSSSSRSKKSPGAILNRGRRARRVEGRMPGILHRQTGGTRAQSTRQPDPRPRRVRPQPSSARASDPGASRSASSHGPGRPTIDPPRGNDMGATSEARVHAVPPCTAPLRGSLRLCQSAILPIGQDRDRDLRDLRREDEDHRQHRRSGRDQAHPGASREPPRRESTSRAPAARPAATGIARSNGLGRGLTLTHRRQTRTAVGMAPLGPRSTRAPRALKFTPTPRQYLRRAHPNDRNFPLGDNQNC